MKFKRSGSLILSILMALSLCLSCATNYPVTVYAQENTDTQQTSGNDNTEKDSEGLCTHVCSEESGCIQVECVHEHDETCGYKEGDEESCHHVCSEESGCITKNCIHEHDEECGYQEEPTAPPLQVLLDQDGQDTCTCTSRCTEGAVDSNCPVCAENPQNCTFTTVTVGVDTGRGYAQCGADGTRIEISVSIDGAKVDEAVVRIALTAEEAALVQDADGQTDWTLEGKTLILTLENDADKIDMAAKIVNIEVQSEEPATIDISEADISVILTPDIYTNNGLVSTEVTGGRLTFVQLLPTENTTYGSGTEFAAQVEAVPVLYVDSEGQPMARQERAPDFTLYYQVEEQESAALQGDTLPFGLASIPEITVTSEEGKWTGAVKDAGTLPSKVLVWENGAYAEKKVRWYLEPSYPQDYYENAGELVEITDENAAGYPAGLGRGWYFIGGEEPYPDDIVTVKEFLSNLEHDVYWADNADSESKRPDSLDGFYELQFAMDGSSDYQTLTTETMAKLGLKDIPKPTVTQSSGVWQVSWANSLPSKVSYSDSTGSGVTLDRDVNWRVVFNRAPENYTMVEVTSENAGDYSSVTNQYGTYYVLETSLTFTARIYQGNSTIDEKEIRKAFLDEFYLDAAYTGNQHQYFQLASVQEDGHYQPVEDPEDPSLISVTITNLWRYNLDNTRINYSIREGKSDEDYDNKLTGVSGLEDGDYFSVSYDNSAVPSFSSEVTAVYSGGILKLTLAGTMDYHATKEWLDEGDADNRPDVTMELWRYRSGQSYTTASLVRDETGHPYELTLSEEKPNQDGTYSIDFADDLPKYDPEGYRYRYVVREYLSGENAGRYEQVFGKVNEDGTIEDTYPEASERVSGDTYLYNGGTLSNRLKGSVPVSVTKDWKAASFQSEFEDVKVVMRLQCRYKDTKDDWQDTEYIHEMFGFIAENLTMSYTGSYPQYDARGKELEYRWVEEEVWQGGRVEDDIYIGGAEVESSQEENGTRLFVLEQNGREVTYRSTSEEDSDQNHTTITNTIANVIDYDVTKEFTPAWNPDEYAEEYSFSLFRTTSGSELERYLTFTIDGDTMDEAPEIKYYGTDSPKPTISIQQTEEWKVKISGLPEFDGDGQQYQYLLLEENGSPLQMDTQRDKQGNYATTVYNGPGGSNIILVRKEWIDESDSQHRLPVTVTVYNKDNNTVVNTATLDESNTWYELVSIDDLDYDDVYVLETQVGGDCRHRQPVWAAGVRK